MYGCSSCMYVRAPYACLVPEKARRKTQVPQTGVKDSCELVCGCWQSNQSPLEEQPMFLTTEPSLQLIFETFSLKPRFLLWKRT